MTNTNKATARKTVIALCARTLENARGRARENDDGTTVDRIFDAWTAAKPFADVRKRFAAAINSETEFSSPMTDEVLGY